MRRSQVCEEINALSRRHRGLLQPEHVVEFARSHPDSALHAEFEWDINRAAEQAWLDKARDLIRVHVIVVNDPPRRVRAHISVPSDRSNGGGYRPTISVLEAPEMRCQMVEQCFKDAEQLRKRYHYLEELDAFFDALDRLIQRHRGQMAA